MNILENWLLYLFVPIRKHLKPFGALQPFKRLVCFVVKVVMTKITDMVVWVGILTLCLYQKNWTLMNLKNNKGNLNSMDGVELNQYSYNGSSTYFVRLSFQVQIEKKTNVIHCNQIEHCTYWCLHLSIKLL